MTPTQRLYHPAFGGYVHAAESYLPDDPDSQVAATISLMRRYALEDSHAPAVAANALEAIGNVDPRSLTQHQIVSRVFDYVKGRVQFAEDSGLAGMGGLDNVPGAPVVEVLIRPRDMAVMCAGGGCKRLGDCDDFSMYTAALLRCLGVRCSYVTVAADSAEPERYSHVYVAAYPDGQRIPMDTSHGPRPGWEAPNVTRIEEWPVSPAADVVGLALLAGVAAWWLRKN